MRSIAAGEAGELRRVGAKLRTVRGNLRTVAPHLHVLRPLAIPPAARSAGACSCWPCART